MAKNRIRDFDVDPANNTDIGGTGILGSNNVRNFDDGFRTLMAYLAQTNAGTEALDDTFSICDPSDNTKKARFDCGGITTATTRIITLPNASGTIPLTALAQTWSGVQTFTNGIVLGSGSELGIADGGTGAATAATARTNLGVPASTLTISAGDGLTGGGSLAANRTITMGTPSSIGNSTANDTTSTSHTHALDATFAEVYTGSTQDLTNYPVGTTLFVSFDSSGGPDRNASDTIYLSGDKSFTFASGSTALSGTWRSRGYNGGSGQDSYLMQRTA